MNLGKTVFSQLMDFLPQHQFRKCIGRYRGNHQVRSFSCLDQFFCMAFAQVLIDVARPLYANDDFGLELNEAVYALDSSTIELCLSIFPWARYQKQNELLDFIRCWICAAPCPPASGLPMAKSAT